MCLRSLFCRWLCKPTVPDDMPMPQGLEDIDLSEMIGILGAAFPGVQIFIKDTYYQTTTLEEMRRYLAYDTTDENEYGKWFDCDNFSFTLMGGLSNKYWGIIPSGIIWVQIPNSSPHALNIFIDKDREIWLIEPENDEVFSLPETWKPYLIII